MQTFNGIDSKFRLAILVARRAKQLIGGVRRRVEIKSDNPLTVAMEEFKQGKIDFDVLNEEEALFGQASETAEAVAEVTPEAPEAALEEEEADNESDLDADEAAAEPEAESES